MTKQEACKIEETCDALMSHYLKTECEVSMALTGKLKIYFDDNYITVNRMRQELSVDYVRYVGFMDDLQEYINKAFLCLTEHSDTFNMLMWSYDHRRELTEE